MDRLAPAHVADRPREHPKNLSSTNWTSLQANSGRLCEERETGLLRHVSTKLAQVVH